MKVTAVEYLFEQINDALIDFAEGKISASIYGIRVAEYKQQAKAIEKQQIIDTHNQGYADGYRDNGNDPIEYYNETYGKAN